MAANGPDALFAVHNNFYLGAYQAAINEAESLTGLGATEATERDCFMYRSYLAQGSYQVRRRCESRS
jgi:coatomer protein complex subunit epsilon